MNIPDFFSANYAEARTKFLSACENRGLTVESHLNDTAKGANGEDLYMDVVRIGPKTASKILILSSATHGVEGFCGSGVQVGMLTENMLTLLPDDTAVLMIHAINPHGFSHLRRVNEDNVDLNRNFLDFDAPLPENPDYADVHHMLLPDDWEGTSFEAAQAKIDDYIEEKGLSIFQAAVTGGQHIHDDGLFFGGFGPSWTNKTLRAVVAIHAADCKHLAMLDFHTGLGPYGYEEPIYVGDPAGLSRALDWYGDDVTSPEAGTSSSAIVRGTINYGICESAPKASHTCVALEYGTIPVLEVLEALRADNWLYIKGNLESDQGKAIKKQVRDAFYCDADDWKEMIWKRGISVIGMGLAGLEKET
ncbi:MAG: hypothetical protein COB93_11585 [Sneathiella sp.]|nr:MAG: hypothetical protein COB93_11585 [Sneathiella sp.]